MTNEFRTQLGMVEANIYEARRSIQWIYDFAEQSANDPSLSISEQKEVLQIAGYADTVKDFIKGMEIRCHNLNSTNVDQTGGGQVSEGEPFSLKLRDTPGYLNQAITSIYLTHNSIRWAQTAQEGYHLTEDDQAFLTRISDQLLEAVPRLAELATSTNKGKDHEIWDADQKS